MSRENGCYLKFKGKVSIIDVEDISSAWTKQSMNAPQSNVENVHNVVNATCVMLSTAY